MQHLLRNPTTFSESSELRLEPARRYLDVIAESFEFTVQYTNFPKSPDGCDQMYFALVSLGLTPPLVRTVLLVKLSAKTIEEAELVDIAPIHINSESTYQFFMDN